MHKFSLEVIIFSIRVVGTMGDKGAQAPCRLAGCLVLIKL